MTSTQKREGQREKWTHRVAAIIFLSLMSSLFFSFKYFFYFIFLWSALYTFRVTSSSEIISFLWLRSSFFFFFVIQERRASGLVHQQGPPRVSHQKLVLMLERGDVPAK